MSRSEAKATTESRADRPRLSLSDQLKEAIENCGMSQQRIAVASGVPQPSICNFMSGKRGLTLETASKIADYLGLVLTERE